MAASTDLTPRRVQRNRLASEDSLVVLAPSLVRIDIRRVESTVETIDRAALVSMQPGAVASKRDQIGERNISVIPHETGSYLMSTIK